MSFQTVDNAFADNPPQKYKNVLGAVSEVDGFTLRKGRRQLLAPPCRMMELDESGTCSSAGQSFSTPSQRRSASVLAPGVSPTNLPFMASSAAVVHNEWADIDEEIAAVPAAVFVVIPVSLP
jgi:hypothetical protein